MRNLQEVLGRPEGELTLVRYPTAVVVHAQDGAIHNGPRVECQTPACLAAGAAEDDAAGSCPRWLPDNTAVPWALRTPCAADGGHDGPCEPTDPLLHGRVLMLLALGVLTPLDEEGEKAARAAYRGLVDERGVSGRYDAFLAGFRQGWAHHAAKGAP